MDATVLKTDADLYAAALARLLGEPIFPVSLSATVERLGDLLTDRQGRAGGHLDLSEPLARQAELLGVVRQVEAELPARGDEIVDLELVVVLRPLHRVLFTLLGPFHPDPAVGEGALPGLNAVDMLASNDPSTDRNQFALTTLLRERARILEALDESRALAEELRETLNGN